MSMEDLIVKQLFKKIFNRPLTLLDCQYWDLGERVGLPKVCGNAVFFEPIFIYKMGKGMAVYYNFTDPDQNPDFLVNYFNKHQREFDALARKYLKNCHKLLRIVEENKASNFIKIFRLIYKEIWPMVIISNILSSLRADATDRKLWRRAFQLRAKTEKLEYVGGGALLELAKLKIPSELVDFVEFLTFEEVNTGRWPPVPILRKRRQGFIYFKGELHGDELKKFAKKNHFEIIDEVAREGKKIRGFCAVKGKARGMVRIIFERSQLDKVLAGDILIASMTTPDFLPAMKMAGAIVTDEGGITCHAAIVSRELKIPCVIGTKIATQVLKDGDSVEVDANRGAVRIIRRAK